MAHILESVEGYSADVVPVKRALLSVSDKTGLIELATFLHEHDVELLSTGGTAKALREADLPVIDVSEYTDSPEILGGRVKTLHPKIHGALLSVRGNALHEREMLENGINKIDLVVMNLYPFEQAVASGSSFAQCVENIDIGGPSMLRSSAKNHAYVAIVTSPGQYAELLLHMRQQGCAHTTLQMRRALAATAFATSAAYDAAISVQFGRELSGIPSSDQADAPALLSMSYQHSFCLKYGCNPHQRPAGIYRPLLTQQTPFSVVNGTPGYINLLDACNAWQLVRELRQALALPAAASFKHCSPAGAAVGLPLSSVEAQAYERPFDTSNGQVNTGLSAVACAYVRARNADPMCSFGDFVAISDIVDECTAKVLKTEVCDGIIAPGYDEAALSILRAKKKGSFIILQGNVEFQPPRNEFREVMGVGFYQRRNDALFSADLHLQRVVTAGREMLPASALRDLTVASIAVKYTQSNSVGYAVNGQMVGVGAGQQSRVDCVKLAARKVSTWFLRQHPKVLGLPFKNTVKRQDRVNARVRYIEGDIEGAEMTTWSQHFETVPPFLSVDEKNSFLRSLRGVSLSSDAFFPFRDSIDHATKVGVEFVAQPGGSMADAEVIAACEEYGVQMAFTDLRLFHH